MGCVEYLCQQEKEIEDTEGAGLGPGEGHQQGGLGDMDHEIGVAKILGLMAAEVDIVNQGIVGKKRPAKQQQGHCAEGGAALNRQGDIENDEQIAYGGEYRLHAGDLGQPGAGSAWKPLIVRIFKRRVIDGINLRFYERGPAWF